MENEDNSKIFVYSLIGFAVLAGIFLIANIAYKINTQNKEEEILIKKYKELNAKKSTDKLQNAIEAKSQKAFEPQEFVPDEIADPAPANMQSDYEILPTVDPNWVSYINHTYRFSIQAPRYTELNISEPYDVVPVKIIDDTKHKMLSMKIANTGHNYFLGWEFDFENIDAEPGSEEEFKQLDNFIKRHYGPYCNLGEIVPSSDPDKRGVFDIVLATPTDGDENIPPKCFINYVSKAKYSREVGTAIAWDLGQAPTFLCHDCKENPEIRIEKSLYFNPSY